jgi:hypothetical protein
VLNVIIGQAISFKNTSEIFKHEIYVISEKYLRELLIEIDTNVKSSDQPNVKYVDFPLLNIKKHEHIVNKKNALIDNDKFSINFLSINF